LFRHVIPSGRQSFHLRSNPAGRPNAQNGGTPSAPGAVGAHPFQIIALRKRRAMIAKNLTVDVRSSV
jgi:hypothetical protein